MIEEVNHAERVIKKTRNKQNELWHKRSFIFPVSTISFCYSSRAFAMGLFLVYSVLDLIQLIKLIQSGWHTFDNFSTFVIHS